MMSKIYQIMYRRMDGSGPFLGKETYDADEARVLKDQWLRLKTCSEAYVNVVIKER